MAGLFTDEERQILEARAARLTTGGAAQKQRMTRVVVFQRGTARYALAANSLLGVRPQVTPTPLIGAPPQVLGLTHLSGRIVPVLDLERLTHPDASAGASAWALWVTAGPHAALLVADDVLGTEDLPVTAFEADIQGAFGGTLSGCLRAVLPGPLLVLDAGRLLQREIFNS